MTLETPIVGRSETCGQLLVARPEPLAVAREAPGRLEASAKTTGLSIGSKLWGVPKS